MRHLLALSGSVVSIRHWFEINLDDASMEHGARVEIRRLRDEPHRGSESASQLVTVDETLWRADLFDRLGGPAGSFAAAHYHPRFSGSEPCARVWDARLTADPWGWLGDQVASLGGAAAGTPWPLRPEDAAELPGLAGEVVDLARRFSPVLCGSPAQCFELTRDVRDTVRMMIAELDEPARLDTGWVAPWVAP